MKPWIPKWLWGVVLVAGLCCAAGGTAFAHTMPEGEATLILPKPPRGQWEIVPHKTTLGHLDAFGEQFLEKEEFSGDGMRFARYSVYHGTFVFLARTGANDDRPASELPISGYDVKGLDLHTPSHFLVSAPYEEVTAKYGMADHVLHDTPGLVTYIYEFAGRPTQLIFDVDEAGIIRAIRYRSEV